MSISWWPSNRKAEEEVRKQGGVRVPPYANSRIGEIIDKKFGEMQNRLNDFDVELDPLLLVQIASFEKGFKIQINHTLTVLREKTKDYGVLTRDDAVNVIQAEIKKAFGFLAGMAGESPRPLENYPKRILWQLEWEIHYTITDYVNKWAY